VLIFAHFVDCSKAHAQENFLSILIKIIFMENQNQNITSGEHISYWLNTIPAIAFKKLDKNLETDVVIVGGGIAGVTTAYCLLKSGKKVALVEDGYIGSGETGRTTAHAVNAYDDRYYRLEEDHGEETAKLVAQSHSAAIDFIERTSLEENIQCDFERLFGYLFLHPSDERDSLYKELHAAKKAGIEIDELPFLPGFKEEIPCLRFSHQGQLHPLKYLAGLCHAIIKMGGEIYTQTHASKIDHEGIVTSNGYKVNAKYVVVATNSPVNNKYVIHLKQQAFRTYVIGARIKKGVLPRALWWDSGDFSANKDIPPYHYIRTQPYDETHDLVICGGEDHPTGIADDEKINEEDRYALLEYWLRKRLPIEDILYTWSGQVMETMDSLAYIGRNPHDKKNVFVVTGDSGNGITHGTIAGMLITDLINGKKNEWEKIYDPSRVKLFKVGASYIKEFANGLLAGMKRGKKGAKHVELGTLANDEGKVLDVEGEKFAAYRDDKGELHVLSAVCQHLGCTVKWNNDEKSWDCPCHGSRYNCDGKVMNGPANEDLTNYSYKYKTNNIKHDVV
jgi:glycine/D-amino acid oxidase-like deaminating enzyme/nitrite reductase/ring-hydroxylating ferredoxin subunit